jgi:hypothetical protein
MSYSTRRSHGGFNKGSPIQKPVEVGKQYEVDVTEISRKGDGIEDPRVRDICRKWKSWK